LTAAAIRTVLAFWERIAPTGFCVPMIFRRPSHSDQVFSVPVEGRRKGGNSDRRMDGGLREFTHAFFG
jgi:hypothetical protein